MSNSAFYPQYDQEHYMTDSTKIFLHIIATYHNPKGKSFENRKSTDTTCKCVAISGANYHNYYIASYIQLSTT